MGRMEPIKSLFEHALDTVRPVDSGETAQYIPELAVADPDPLAMAVTGPRGVVIGGGDDERTFTIQSISKPFVLALAMTRLGREEVLRRVGVEPSGEPFNAISLEPETGRPANPLVNAGAIATTALVPTEPDRDRVILDVLSSFAGRMLEVDEDVYRSESATGDRNRALAYLLRSHGVIGPDVTGIVESYFRQCSVLVTVRDLAVMAGTLAFGGRNPVTGQQVVSEHVARDVVSIMSSCGMYDFSGEWLLRVGLPAKSGVSGGIVAVVPAQFGVAVFSPRLDPRGNSTRGIQLLEMLSTEFGMHVFDLHDGSARPEIAVTRAPGEIAVRLDGELGFGGAEHVLATLDRIAETAAAGESIVLDASELSRANPSAMKAVLHALAALGDRGRLLS